MFHSVNSPGRMSTSIDPECCLTMMSWLSESRSPVPSPARLGGEEGVEHLLPDIARNPGTVIANPDLYPVAEVFRRRGKRKLLAIAVCLSLALSRGVETVRDQVAKDPGDLLSPSTLLGRFYSIR
jgi:hypothetical protein